MSKPRKVWHITHTQFITFQLYINEIVLKEEGEGENVNSVKSCQLIKEEVDLVT